MNEDGISWNGSGSHHTTNICARFISDGDTIVDSATIGAKPFYKVWETVYERITIAFFRLRIICWRRRAGGTFIFRLRITKPARPKRGSGATTEEWGGGGVLDKRRAIERSSLIAHLRGWGPVGRTWAVKEVGRVVSR